MKLVLLCWSWKKFNGRSLMPSFGKENGENGKVWKE